VGRATPSTRWSWPNAGPRSDLALREGHGPGEIACIDLAQLKATRIDLGDLEPGSYTVADGGGGTARTTFEVS
jgi:hypothetical protein